MIFGKLGTMALIGVPALVLGLILGAVAAIVNALVPGVVGTVVAIIAAMIWSAVVSIWTFVALVFGGIGG